MEPRYKGRRQYPDATPQSLNERLWEVIDLADDSKVILAKVPQDIMVDVVEQLNKAREDGIEEGKANGN